MTISPVFFERGNDKTFVGLSLPRYVLFNLRERLLPQKTIESSYFSPRIAFLISTKGKRGSLPFVVFLIETFSFILSAFSALRERFSQANEILDLVITDESFQSLFFLHIL